MQVIRSLDEIDSSAFSAGTVVAIGKFDGVHVGHQALIARITQVAGAEQLMSVVFTFANNPLQLLRPESCPQAIMSTAQRLDVLEAAGVDACVMAPFNADFAAITAHEFVEHILVQQLHVKHVCVGEGFRFGSKEQGNISLLTELGAQFGFQVHVIEPVVQGDVGRVSSSLIRAAILDGNVDEAASMLGRELTLRGEVVQGDARGREIGYPTANLGGHVEGLRPADGVYAGWVRLHGKDHPAAISVGANVTFDPEGEHRVEAYLLDFDQAIYGEPIEIRFVHRLRSMQAFATLDELLVRMADDVSRTRALLVAP